MFYIIGYILFAFSILYKYIYILFVQVVLGLSANNNSVRLEILDKERHIISSSIVGGEHRLTNYRSVTTLHSSISGTVAVESYLVDAPPGHMAEDTCTFADTIVRCNLHSLAQIDENIVK
ncbi:hypothetical protein CsatB_028578 [Cannabis sativa]